MQSDLANDWFETLDENHDGQLSKAEYQKGVDKLTAFSQLPLENKPRGSSFLPELSQDGFVKAFTSGVAMIIATEIGDKTFFIAAVLSMRNSRSAVFGGAIAALIVMTILSTVMGLVLPAVMDKKYTHILGGILFLYFGFKLLLESRGMEVGKTSEELEEVEEELAASNKKSQDVESGSVSKKNNPKAWPQVVGQAFTLTFLAEWGDRSQIATIALAAAKNPYGVTVGGCLGHALCTGLAVLGGRMLAARISEKTVSQMGGLIFMVFGVHSLFFEE